MHLKLFISLVNESPHFNNGVRSIDAFRIE